MNYKDINDNEIIYMIRDSDDYYGNLLIKKYMPIINRLASDYLAFAKRYGADFDDLVQECYIGFYDAVSSYSENSGSIFYTYVSLCMKRHLISYCRNLGSGKNSILSNCIADESLYYYGDNEKNPENTFLEKSIESTFNDYKNSLSILDSSILELRYNGFSYNEIAILLDISVNLVDGKLYRMRKQLKCKF